MKTIMTTDEMSPATAKARLRGLMGASEMVDSSARLLNSKILKTNVPTLSGKIILFLRSKMAVGCCEPFPMIACANQKVRRTMKSPRN